jgi:hypothetical protein
MFSELYKREYIAKNSQKVDKYWGLIEPIGKNIGGPEPGGSWEVGAYD